MDYSRPELLVMPSTSGPYRKALRKSDRQLDPRTLGLTPGSASMRSSRPRAKQDVDKATTHSHHLTLLLDLMLHTAVFNDRERSSNLLFSPLTVVSLFISSTHSGIQSVPMSSIANEISMGQDLIRRGCSPHGLLPIPTTQYLNPKDFPSGAVSPRTPH